ncbi:MAG: serine hydrolase domain-containing protein [Bacteroidia bacterium]
MMLQEEGKLLITDPLGKYIPAFKETTVAVPDEDGGYEIVKAKRSITIRDLLTHTAGIGYGGGPPATFGKKPAFRAGILPIVKSLSRPP